VRRKLHRPTRKQWRAAIIYTRQQFRIMFPKHNPRRHPKYRETVEKMAGLAHQMTEVIKAS